MNTQTTDKFYDVDLDAEKVKDKKCQEVTDMEETYTCSTHEDKCIEDASWNDVYTACCVGTPQQWGVVFLHVVLIIYFLYCFLITLDLMGTSAQVMTGCIAGELFGDDANPVAGLMIGIICTALVQSSSTTTSIIVSLTGSAISVQQGIYMVMGANIGTTITNTIVAIGQMGDGEQLERAFAAATVNDFFNYLTVILLLPVEVATGYLYNISHAVTKNIKQQEGEAWNSPLDKIIEPVSDRIILRNRKLLTAVAKGTGSCALDDGFYPIICDGVPSAKSCSQVGLIPCSSDYGCPAFFSANATAADDKVSGAVMFVLSIFGLFLCMALMGKAISSLLSGTSSQVIRKATNLNGYLAIAVGCGLTVAVQSSSITTSVLTPLVGFDIIRLEQMYPLTLGANLGTTVTAIMAALVQSSTPPLQVALAHMFFNLTGIAIWYPVPFMRNVPMYCAIMAGKATRIWKGFPFVYIAIAFFVVPALLLGLSSLLTSDSLGCVVLGTVLVSAIVIYLGYTVYQFKYNGAGKRMVENFRNRQAKRDFYNNLEMTITNLQTDVDVLQVQISAVTDHSLYQVGDEEAANIAQSEG